MKGSLHMPLACDIQNKEMFSWKMFDIHLNINYVSNDLIKLPQFDKLKKNTGLC